MFTFAIARECHDLLDKLHTGLLSRVVEGSIINIQRELAHMQTSTRRIARSFGASIPLNKALIFVDRCVVK